MRSLALPLLLLFLAGLLPVGTMSAQERPEMERQLQRLENELNALRGELSILSGNVANRKRLLADYERRLQELRRLLEDLRERLNNSEEYIAILEDSNRRMKKRLEELLTELSELRRSFESYVQEVEAEALKNKILFGGGGIVVGVGLGMFVSSLLTGGFALR